MWAAWAQQQQQQVHSGMSFPDTCWDGRERPVGRERGSSLGFREAGH